MKNEIPCHNCTEREVGCHGGCNRYNAWKAVHDKQRIEEREKRAEIWRIMDYNKAKLNKLRKIAKHKEEGKG